MRNNSRRGFINKVINGSLAVGALPLFPLISKDKSPEKKEKELPVINEVDICVLGGSCTGVFAAVRASRLGAKVAIVERQNAFGGNATNAMVNVWHQLMDTEHKKQIIAGLTLEVIERLSRRNAFVKNSNSDVFFNSQELKIELDELVLESGLKPYLHTLFSEPYFDENGKLTGVIVDN
jgi:flavin-dependent dehydrogenase